MKHRGVRSHYCFHLTIVQFLSPGSHSRQSWNLGRSKPAKIIFCKQAPLLKTNDGRLADLKAPPAWTGQIGKSCRSWWSLHCRTPQGLCWPPGSAAAPMSRCLPSRWGVESGEADFTFKVHRGNLPECDLSSYLHQISKKDWEIK